MKPGDVFSSGNSLYLRINRRKSVNLLSPHEDLVDLDPSTYDKDEWKVEFNLYEMMRDIHNNPPKEDEITITVNKDMLSSVYSYVRKTTTNDVIGKGLSQEDDRKIYRFYDMLDEMYQQEDS